MRKSQNLARSPLTTTFRKCFRFIPNSSEPHTENEVHHNDTSFQNTYFSNGPSTYLVVNDKAGETRDEFGTHEFDSFH